jgi:sigma-B regulation protein RsbU (phosphoserine phosphatase)
VLRVRACSIRLLDAESGELTIRAVHNLSEVYLRKGPVRVQESPIDAEALSGKTVYVPDAPNDPRTQYPQEARAEGIVSCLVVGMFHAGEQVGVLRVYADRHREFSAFEAGMLQTLATSAAAAIVNARLFEQQLQAERIARQLRIAGEVQRRMTPRFAPRHPHAEFGFIYEPTYEVGGDYFDFISLPEDNWGLAVADVMGKGVPAGLLMASLRSVLRVYAGTLYAIAEIMSRINVQICTDTLPSEFISAFYGVLSADARTLTYVNAGHNPPILLRGGEVDFLEPTGLVLGISTEETYGQEVLKLRAGDVLAIYSDGMPDASNFQGEHFGLDRLIASLRKYADLQAPAVAKNVLWDVRRFKGLADQTDDMTLVIVKIN